jgi:hypothetical protein
MNGLNNISANTVFTDSLEVNNLTIDVVGTAPTRPPLDNSTKIATTAYVDTAVSTVGGVSLSGNNVFTGFNSYNTNLPTSTISATTANELTNKTYVDGEITTAGASYAKLAVANAFTSTNTFDSFLPTSTISATSANELTNKTYVDGAITTAGGSYAKLASANAFTSTNTFNSFLPTSTISATTANELVNLTTLNSAITTAGGSYVTLSGTETIPGQKTFSAAATYITGDLVIGSGGSGKDITCENIIATMSNSGNLYCTQNLGTVNIATRTTRTGPINIGTGNSAKTITIGGTADTQVLNSNTLTINTGTSTGNAITHSSTSTAGDDMKLTATGGYIARLGEGSATAGLTLLGVDSGTSIIRSTTSALQIRADAGITLTGDITSSNTYTGTNTLTGITQFNNNLRVASTSTIRLGTASTGTLIGQTFTNEVTAQNINASDKFIFRTSLGGDIISFADSGILVSSATSLSNNININQATYPSTGTTQIGYTITKTFGPTVLGDTTGTFTVVGTGQALGTNKGVYLITCGFELTNSGSDTVNNKALCLSLSSGSGVPVNANGAWEYYEEINDSMGAAGTRFIGTLCGVYIKTTTSAESLFLNGYANTTGSQTLSATGTCSITRIG